MTSDVTNNRWKRILKVAIFIALIYFPIFLHLEQLPFRLWDESRIVNTSIEMFDNENYFITHFDGNPEMWSTKPPLLAWFQVVCIKLLGFRELSFRLPSALAAVATIFLLVWFSRKYFQSTLYGVLIAIVLVTSPGYIGEHAVRTADFDSLLTLFTTAYILFFFLYSESKSIKYLHLFFLCVVGAIFTKNNQGLIFLPALAIYMFMWKKSSILLNKWLYIDFIISTAIVLSFYLYREYHTPGYIDAILSHDFGLISNTVENHSEPFEYFIDGFINGRYSYWVWFIPLGIIFGLYSKDPRSRKFIGYATLLTSFYLLTISISETKVFWYDIPLYPLFALIVAMFIYQLYNILKLWEIPARYFSRPVLSYSLLIGLLACPYYEITNSNYHQKEHPYFFENYQMSNYLRGILRSGVKLSNVKVCFSQPNQHVKPYIKMLNLKGSSIDLIRLDEISAGDMVVVSQKSLKDQIFYFYNFILKDDYKGVQTLYITGEKARDEEK